MNPTLRNAVASFSPGDSGTVQAVVDALRHGANPYEKDSLGDTAFDYIEKHAAVLVDSEAPKYAQDNVKSVFDAFLGYAPKTQEDFETFLALEDKARSKWRAMEKLEDMIFNGEGRQSKKQASDVDLDVSLEKAARREWMRKFEYTSISENFKRQHPDKEMARRENVEKNAEQIALGRARFLEVKDGTTTRMPFGVPERGGESLLGVLKNIGWKVAQMFDAPENGSPDYSSFRSKMEAGRGGYIYTDQTTTEADFSAGASDVDDDNDNDVVGVNMERLLQKAGTGHQGGALAKLREKWLKVESAGPKPRN